MFIPEVASDELVEVFVHLSDGIVHETTASTLEPYVDQEFDKANLDELIRTTVRPSRNPQFIRLVKDAVNGDTIAGTQLFIVLTTVLDSSILAPILTGSTTLVRNMTLDQKEALLRSWRDSNITAKRKIFRLVHGLTVSTFNKLASEQYNKAMGYPGRETRESVYENQVIDQFKYSMIARPEGKELHLPDVDVLIIGSGSGAGVVAHTLANEGLKTLVLEKGKYYSNNELSFNDLEGFQNLYQKGGLLATANQQVTVLAGSTFGGGSTVNWSACLKTPFKVRNEWYTDYGLEWAAGEHFESCQQYVWDKMGASTEAINLSLGNEVILEGSKKLGYKAKKVAQNIGGHKKHSCGFCYLGCKYGIKQGSVNCWFRDAASKGSTFLDQVRVLRIIHENGKATAALCHDLVTGNTFKITGPKKFVVAGGSLNTPVILQNSGFKNKHIGANLKLHPVTVLFGDFGKEKRTAPYEKDIMTAVATEVDDLDGKAHGAKVETILTTPMLEAVFLPWESSDKFLQDSMKYQNLTPMLLITRDTSSGTVSCDSRRPDAISINYEINKFDRNALLQAALVTADMLYIEGAKEIFSPQAWSPSFKTSKRKEERDINDKDYQEWRKAMGNVSFDNYGCAYGSAHQMSSCRMSGRGPGYGACDLKGRLFECSNIYIADASTLPTASGVNPMITTMTFARHVALEVVKDIQKTAKL
ncbi:GMC oxidoreductase-domain-containing protein [Scheffersomyces xylosifermentans]|uniref:GMC oxidoreductase-domain-containing protein n=1 Tax=Scheffersomyces xylosifermentans TaxID=1304137 RepID=UPI00315C4C0E